MAIAIVDWELFLLLFTFVLTIELSMERPVYGIFAGIVGIIFGIRVATLTGSTVLSGVIFGTALFITIHSIFRRYKLEEWG